MTWLKFLILFCFLFPSFLPGSQNQDQEGLNYMIAGEYEKAIEFYQDRIEQLKSDEKMAAAALDNLGLAYQQTGQLERAEKAYLEAQSKDPDLVLPYVHMCSVLRNRGDFLTAATACLKGLERNESLYQLHDELWKIYAALGRKTGYSYDLIMREIYHIERAMELLPKEIEINPVVLKELNYLILLERDVRQAAVSGKSVKIIHSDNLADLSADRADYSQVIELPEDRISDEQMKSYLQKALARTSTS